MFVHFERRTLPVLTTWTCAWQDKTVIDARDKLLKSISNMGHKSSFGKILLGIEKIVKIFSILNKLFLKLVYYCVP